MEISILGDMEAGKFIVLEGGEGVGKTTQLAKLKEYLPGAYPGTEFVFTREPGGSPYAELIRGLILGNDAKDADGPTMIGLLMAARADHLHHLVLPALSAGKQVISDRYMGSSYAYQIVAQQSPELEDIFWAYAKLMRQPDLTLFFDQEPSTALKRVEGRNEVKTHFDARDLVFHERVREGYARYFEKSGTKVAKIDAAGTVDEVWSAVQGAVASVL